MHTTVVPSTHPTSTSNWIRPKYTAQYLGAATPRQGSNYVTVHSYTIHTAEGDAPLPAGVTPPHSHTSHTVVYTPHCV